MLFKQRDNRFYPPSAWSLAMMLVRVPFQLVEAFIFAGIIYFWVGKTPAKFGQPQCLSGMLSDIVVCSGAAAALCLPRSFCECIKGPWLDCLLYSATGRRLLKHLRKHHRILKTSALRQGTPVKMAMP